MRESGFVTQADFKAHRDKDWRTVHHIWPNIRGVSVGPVPKGAAPPHTHVHIDITDWGDYIDQAVKQASSPLFANLNLGATPLIRQSAGEITFQTDEGANTNTIVAVKGKGTGFGDFRVYDQDNAEYMRMRSASGYGDIAIRGTTPVALTLQRYTPVDIRCWNGITEGNPYFYIYGFKVADAVKYLRLSVSASGYGYLEAESRLYLDGSNIQVVPDIYFVSDAYLADNKIVRFGSGSDYSIGYHEPTDSLQIVDGSTLNANVRIALLANGNVGIGTASPGAKLEVYDNGADVEILIHEDAGTHEARLRLRRGAVDWELINKGSFRIEYEDSEKFRIGSDGKVGIGTALPYALLHVNDGVVSGMDSLAWEGVIISDSVSPALWFEDTGEGAGDRVMGCYYASENLIFASLIDDGSAFDTANLLVINRNGKIGINNASPDTTQEGLTIGSAISIKASHLNVRGADAGTYVMTIEQDAATGWGLYIDTDSVDAGDPALKIHNAIRDIFVVQSNGNVGIGQASPTERLHIHVNDGDNVQGLRITQQDTGEKAIDVDTIDYGIFVLGRDTVQGKYLLKLQGDTGATEALYVGSDGQVGIGTVSPDEALQVIGIVKADTFHLQAGVTPNLAWLSDVTLGTLEEGETIRYDQATAKFIDSWGIDYDNPRLVWKMYTDFFSAGVDSNDPWVGAAFGAGGKTALAGTSNHPGIIRLSSGDVGGYRFMTATNCILIAGAEHSEFCFKTGAIIAGAYARLGFQDSNTATAPTDGAWIDISGATLTGKTKNNGAGSTTGTNYVLAATTWYRGKIAVLANQLLTIAAGGYVNCVAGDVGKQVQVDGEEFGLLDSYDNPTRVWRVSTGRLIPAGSAITITAGTGAGTSTVDSVTTVKEVLFALYTLVAGEQTIVWTDSLTTNIPIAAGRETGHGAVMYVATSVARYFDLDMMIATRAGYITR